MAVAEESSTTTMMIDDTYEFSAPRFFDFTLAESEDDTRRAELWFDTALAYAPSPFMTRIKTGRSFKVETMCDFSEAADHMQKAVESSNVNAANCSSENKCKPEVRSSSKTRKEETACSEANKENNPNLENAVSTGKSADEEEGNRRSASALKIELAACSEANKENNPNLENAVSTGKSADEEEGNRRSASALKIELAACSEANKENNPNLENAVSTGKSADEEEGNRRSASALKIELAGEAKSKTEVYSTPKPPVSSRKGGLLTDSKKNQSARHIASLVRNPSALKQKSQSQSSAVQGIKPSSVKKAAGSSSLAHENQAIKRQKLEGGQSRQILNLKPPQPLLHKSKLGLSSSKSNLCSSILNRTHKEERKVYVREPAVAPVPFVSTAEMMKKFQSNTRDLSLPRLNSSFSHDAAASAIQRKAKLTLTRPKEPEFETAQRIRSVRLKSTAELEEEMMAKIPKFKARPLNKKILEAPTLQTLPRSAPKPPEFQEFHLETMARANQNAESASIASTEMSHQASVREWKPHLTEPKTPVLHTSLRARPPAVKSSFELEKVELEKIPRFKARPLNKKIFESKGELGIFCNTKKQVTVPQEFHFATNERIAPPAAVTDLFEKLSIKSDSHHDDPIPRNTKPTPFHLLTEERGAQKEKKFVMELVEKQFEEERARVPRATPYPYTTDYPVIPPKPEPKPCTRAEPFQLESLVRHEEEKLRELEERQRMEKEEAQLRIFRAQPVLQEDPIPLPEKVRKPLTQVQKFNLHVDHRASDRAEFDQRVKEKEMLYKRYREESEAARMVEEERALKQLRREMVPHARPVPKFDHPFCPKKSSKETTKAKSPTLRVLRRKQQRMVMDAVSSAASNMR